MFTYTLSGMFLTWLRIKDVWSLSDTLMSILIFKKQLAFSQCNQVSMLHIRGQEVSPMQSSSWPQCKSTRPPKPTPPHATTDNRVNGWSTSREVKSTKWGQIYQTPLATVADDTWGKVLQSSLSKHTYNDLEESPEKPEDFERGQFEMLALILLCLSTLEWMFLSHCFVYHCQISN